VQTTVTVAPFGTPLSSSRVSLVPFPAAVSENLTALVVAGAAGAAEGRTVAPPPATAHVRVVGAPTLPARSVARTAKE
jgi:hypothetical protein